MRSCLNYAGDASRVVWAVVGDYLGSTRGYPVPDGGDCEAVAVFTDLEPDGLLALHLLRRRGFCLRWACVGDGDVRGKAAKLRKYLASLDSAGMEIVLGSGEADEEEKDEDDEGSSSESPRKLRLVAMLYSLLELSETCTRLLLLKKPTEVLAALHAPETAELAKRVLRKFDVQVASDSSFGSDCCMTLFGATTTPFKSVTIFYADEHGAAMHASSLSSFAVLSATSAPDVVAALTRTVATTPFVRVLVASISRRWMETYEQARQVTYERPEDQARHDTFVDNLRSGGMVQCSARNPILATICYHKLYSGNVHVKQIAPPAIRLYANLTWTRVVADMAALI